MIATLFMAVLLSEGPVSIEGERQIDPARSLFLTVKPAGLDLRDRFTGFSVAEDYDEDGATNWRLVPEPCATVYKLRPFAYQGRVYGPVYFDPPPGREPVTGEMEADPERDLPPLSWKLVGEIAGILLVALALLAALVFLVKNLVRRVKEHRMSPIERAWVELDRLLGRKLPEKGRYKDFYVELTMVVRRYIQRKYGIAAPHMTTEEFLASFKGDALKEFLESADMVKFAGVQATESMAQEATEKARGYLKSDELKEQGARSKEQVRK